MEDKTMKEKTVNYMDGFFGTVSLKIVLGYLKNQYPVVSICENFHVIHIKLY